MNESIKLCWNLLYSCKWQRPRHWWVTFFISLGSWKQEALIEKNPIDFISKNRKTFGISSIKVYSVTFSNSRRQNEFLKKLCQILKSENWFLSLVKSTYLEFFLIVNFRKVEEIFFWKSPFLPAVKLDVLKT